MKIDAWAKIIYDLDTPSKSKILTNAKDLELLEELFSDFVRANAGQGADNSKPNKKSRYEILIMLDMSDDTFSVKSDTGNKGLTCGIVMSALGDIKNIEIQLRRKTF